MSSTLAPSSRPKPTVQSDYDQDIYAWALRQARLIRERRFDEIDVDNVAEEVESVGRSERSALTSYLARIMQHMLQWDYQPEKRSQSWATSIRVHRIHAERVIRQNPGLRSRMEEVLNDAYSLAAVFAADEMGVAEAELPRARPYDLDVILTAGDAYAWPSDK